MSHKGKTVIIYKKEDYWNWEYVDGFVYIPIFGNPEIFKTKEEAIKNFKEYATKLEINNYIIEEK